jgi:hypothetical protein
MAGPPGLCSPQQVEMRGGGALFPTLETSARIGSGGDESGDTR